MIEDRVRRLRRGLFDDRPDDPGILRKQVVPAHPGLAGEPGGDHDDVRAGRIGVVVRADDPRVVTDDRRGLGEVESLALRQPLHDVDEDDVGETRLGDPLRGRGADIAGTDDGDLVACHAVGAPSGGSVVIIVQPGCVERPCPLRARVDGCRAAAPATVESSSPVVQRSIHMPFTAPSADIVVIALILVVFGIIVGNFALLGLGALGFILGGSVAVAAGSKA